MGSGPVQDEAPGLLGALEGQARKITAIIRADVLKKVEERLQALRVPGNIVSKVKGYGEYASFFRSDWMVENARIEVFVRRERADEIAPRHHRGRADRSPRRRARRGRPRGSGLPDSKQSAGDPRGARLRRSASEGAPATPTA